MLDWRMLTAGRCCGAELLRRLPLLSCQRLPRPTVPIQQGRRRRLGGWEGERSYPEAAWLRAPLLLRGVGTGVPASTDDCNEVGGSTAGWDGAGSLDTAKSRAAVPRWPSFTAAVLAASSGGSVEWFGAREALPSPRDVLSATRLRADRAFTFSLSIATGSLQ